MFQLILRHHIHEGHLQYLQKLRGDLTGEDDDESKPQPTVMEQIESEKIKPAKNKSMFCDIGLVIRCYGRFSLATQIIRQWM